MVENDECPRGHKLVKFNVPKNYICDQCNTKMLSKCTMFSCHPCNYDLCEKCWIKKGNKLKSKKITLPPARKKRKLNKNSAVKHVSLMTVKELKDFLRKHDVAFKGKRKKGDLLQLALKIQEVSYFFCF